MRPIDGDALWYDMETADWYNNADRDEIAELLVLRAPIIGGWISVKDNPPYNECIAYSEKWDEMIIGYIYETKVSSTGYEAENEKQFLRDVSHWMPKPMSPKEVNNG